MSSTLSSLRNRNSSVPLMALAIAFVALSGFGADVVAQQLPASELGTHQTIKCLANQDVSIRGRSVDSADVAVWVEGNCDVEIIDSYIRSSSIAVRVMGNGEVRIENSFVQGAKGAVVIDGNSELGYANSTLRGGTRSEGRSELDDRGGSYSETIPQVSSGRLSSSTPLSCGEEESLSIVGKIIETDGDGVVVEGECDVLISDSHIIATGSALVVNDQARVRVRNSTLDGRRAALTVQGGQTHVAGSNIRGGIDERGGRFSDGGGNSR